MAAKLTREISLEEIETEITLVMSPESMCAISHTLHDRGRKKTHGNTSQQERPMMHRWKPKNMQEHARTYQNQNRKCAFLQSRYL